MKHTPPNLVSKHVTRAAALGAVALSTCLLATRPALAVQAKQADSFVDSIGVCVHLWYPNTPYTNSYSTIKAKLLAANIRHVRDDLATDRPAGVTAWKDLAASGIKTGYIFTQQWATVDTFKSFLINNNLLSTVDFFEGPNEFNGSRADWVSVLTSYQSDLYTKMKADSLTSSFPVLAPSFLINHISDRNALGDISSIADNGNCHPYPGGAMPSTAQTVNEISSCSINTGTKPVYATEIGYQSALNTTDGHHPASETASAIYLPRVYFDTLSRGVARTYYYQFVDHLTDGGTQTNVEAYFGLVRNDLTERPAYTALKNLTTIMKDPGASFSPGNLNYTLSGTTVKSSLFQKRDGSYYLALWREVSVWNTTTRTDIVPAAASVTVTLPGLSNVESYSPTTSSTAQQTWTAVDTVTVSLQGEVKILKINNRFRLTSRTAGQPMHIENLIGKVQYGPIGAGSWSSQWLLVKNSEGYYLIQSRWNGLNLHTENQQSWVEYGSFPSSYWSTQWGLTKNSEGYFTLQNRWTGLRMNVANLLGYVENSSVAPTTTSAQWSLSAAP